MSCILILILTKFVEVVITGLEKIQNATKSVQQHMALASTGSSEGRNVKFIAIVQSSSQSVYFCVWVMVTISDLSAQLGNHSYHGFWKVEEGQTEAQEKEAEEESFMQHCKNSYVPCLAFWVAEFFFPSVFPPVVLVVSIYSQVSFSTMISLTNTCQWSHWSSL